LADLVIINKADIDGVAAARAQTYISSALRLFGAYGEAQREHQDPCQWHAEVLQISALQGEGVDAFWRVVQRFTELQRSNGAFQARRQSQSLSWMWERIDASLRHQFVRHPAVQEVLQQTITAVGAGKMSASAAARELLRRFGSSCD
jgi:LAO/AO transport system kinase